MEPHLPTSHGEEPQTAGGVRPVVEGEGEPHHEKRSVLRKVKDKAKKIKETLTNYAHGQDHDAEDHAAPVSESAALGGQEVDSGMPKGNLDRPSVTAEDRYEPKITDPPVRSFGERQDEKSGKNKANLEEGHVDHPANVGQKENLGQTKVIIGEQTGMEENLHAPKDTSQAFAPSNYPTGTGGEEAGINPMATSFNKMSVHDEPEPKPKAAPEEKLSTGSHDLFPPEPIPSNTTTTNPEYPESLPQSFDASKPELTGMISSDTSAISDKAASAKDVDAPKLGYARGGNEDAGGGDATKSYSQKIAATAYGKVAGAGSTEVYGGGTGQEGGEKAGIDPIVTFFNKMSVHDEPEPEREAKPGPEQKLSTGTHDQFWPEPIPSDTTTTNLEYPESVPKSFDDTKLEDMPRNKLTGVISSDTPIIEQVSESAAVRSGVGGQEVDSEMPSGNLERPSVTAEDRYESEITDPPVRPFGERQEEKSGQSRTNLEESHVDHPANVGQEENLGQTKAIIGEQIDMEENPRTPKDPSQAFAPSNYETKVDDPIGTVSESATGRSGVGGQEVDSGMPSGNLETPPVTAEDRYESEFTDLPVRPFGERREEKSDMENLEEGHVDHPAANVGQEENLGQTKVRSEEQTGMEDNLHAPKDPFQAFAPSTDTGGEEAGINPIVTSFNKMSVRDELEPESKPKPGLEQKLSSGSHDQFLEEPIPSNTTTTNPENPESVPQNFDVTNPEDMPPDKSSGVISSDTSAFADAQDVDASELGYAGGGNEDAAGDNATKSYAQKIAATVTGAGGTVMSKVYGGGTGQEVEDKKGPDKDVSVKENVAEKFRPSEEDRALSKPKEEAEKTVQEKPEGDRPISEVVSDTRNDDPENEGAMGKVTESEEVAKPLGTGIEDPKEDGDATKIGTEKVPTVGWFRGTVNSWLGGGGESPTSQATTTSGEGRQGHDEDVLAETRHEGEGK